MYLTPQHRRSAGQAARFVGLPPYAMMGPQASRVVWVGGPGTSRESAFRLVAPMPDVAYEEGERIDALVGSDPWELQMQALVKHEGRWYDHLSVLRGDGRYLDLWFDITANFQPLAQAQTRAAGDAGTSWSALPPREGGDASALRARLAAIIPSPLMSCVPDGEMAEVYDWIRDMTVGGTANPMSVALWFRERYGNCSAAPTGGESPTPEAAPPAPRDIVPASPGASGASTQTIAIGVAATALGVATLAMLWRWESRRRARAA